MAGPHRWHQARGRQRHLVTVNALQGSSAEPSCHPPHARPLAGHGLLTSGLIFRSGSSLGREGGRRAPSAWPWPCWFHCSLWEPRTIPNLPGSLLSQNVTVWGSDARVGVHTRRTDFMPGIPVPHSEKSPARGPTVWVAELERCEGAHVTRFAVVACNRAAQRVPRGTCGGAALTAAALRGAWLPGGSLLRTRGVEQEGSGTDARPRRAERCRVLTPAQARPVDVSFCCAASRAPR